MLEVLRRGRFSDGKTQKKTVGNLIATLTI